MVAGLDSSQLMYNRCRTRDTCRQGLSNMHSTVHVFMCCLGRHAKTKTRLDVALRADLNNHSSDMNKVYLSAQPTQDIISMSLVQDVRHI